MRCKLLAACRSPFADVAAAADRHHLPTGLVNIGVCPSASPASPKVSRDPGVPQRRASSLSVLTSEISIVKKSLELRHMASQEAPVLADAIATHRRRSCFHERREKTPACGLPASASVVLLARTRAARRMSRAASGSSRPSAPAHPRLVNGEYRARRRGRTSSLSVTTVAISMMESDSGLRPVHFRSIQMRLSLAGHY